MSTFVCEVSPILSLEEIPGADKIELAVINDFRSIVQKGRFEIGDLCVYIPENAILPDSLLEEMNLVGKLGGSRKNRVKSIKLRGCLSEGLIYPNKNWFLGQDVKNILGIKKFDPHEFLPPTMRGKIRKIGELYEYSFKFDIENIKKNKDIFSNDDDVIFTEKNHGSCFISGYVREKDLYFVSSKGLFADGIFIDYLDEENKTNLWVRAFLEFRIKEKLKQLSDKFPDVNCVYILGEVFGNQDLKYGLINNQISFRAFDIRLNKNYVNSNDFFEVCKSLEIPTVPLLYKGKFSKEILKEMTDGKETISGLSNNIREGVVVRPLTEKWHRSIGRVILKSVSGDYLTRKGETTEFE